jgi:hypothetical protein
MAQHISNDNYILIGKVLGKLAYIYDQANANQATVTTTNTHLYEQVADQGVWEFDGIFAGFTGSINTVINSNLATISKTMATSYLLSATVKAYFGTDPGTTIQSVTAALIAGMTADTKKLTTRGSTGISNFLRQLNTTTAFGVATTAVEAADTGLDIQDSIYHVDAVVV